MSLITILQAAVAGSSLAYIGAAIGAGLVAIGAAIGIGKIERPRWNQSPASLKLPATSVQV